MSAVAESSLELLVLGAVVSSLFVQIPVPVSRSRSRPVSRSLLFQLPVITCIINYKEDRAVINGMKADIHDLGVMVYVNIVTELHA